MKFISIIAILSVVFLGFLTQNSSASTDLAKSFSVLPQFEKLDLSPDGKRIAMLRNSNDQDITQLMTLDLTTNKPYVLMSSDNKQVKLNWFKWANNEDLLISVRYEEKTQNTKYYITRLYTMKFDDQGGEPTQIITGKNLKRFQGRMESHSPQFQDDVIDILPDDPEHILMVIDADGPLEYSVFRVNIKKRSLTRVAKGNQRLRHWLTNQQGEVALGFFYDDKSGVDSGGREISYRDKSGNYHTLYSYNQFTDKPIGVLGFGADPNELYVTRYLGDFKALYKLNIETKEETLVFKDDSADVNGRLIYSPLTRDAIGITHAKSPNGRYYWNDQYAPLQSGLNGIFKQQFNTLIDFSDNEHVYLLYVESDIEPPRYFIGDQHKVTLRKLFSQYPNIDKKSLSPHKLVSYATRDNTSISGYLSIPSSGQAPFPTVIFPHGGPQSRDYAGFDLWASYFTSKGYAVLRPNFRGSSGYGYTFSQASINGWGKEMQDDITDGANWMVEQGYANKNKMCIVGASYGGYAALYATVKTPDLFKCAVSFAGISDLDQLIFRARNFVNRESIEKQIGEDRDDRNNRSPIKNIAKINTPILLVHGEEDRRVDVEQSRFMKEKLEKAKKDYRYVELPYGDHYLSLQSNRTHFFMEMDKFLDKHLQ